MPKRLQAGAAFLPRVRLKPIQAKRICASRLNSCLEPAIVGSEEIRLARPALAAKGR